MPSHLPVNFIPKVPVRGPGITGCRSYRRIKNIRIVPYRRHFFRHRCRLWLGHCGRSEEFFAVPGQQGMRPEV